MYRLDQLSDPLPISRDFTIRGVTDPASQVEALEDWTPADRVTTKLWRCVESLRDIKELLEFASSVAGTKRRRRSRLLAIPLVSLALEARRLCNYILTSTEWKDVLSRKRRDQVSQVLEDLKAVPLGKSSKLKEVRDRYSAHIDEDLFPDHARAIIDSVKPEELITWLQACVGAILGLLDLPAYLWYTQDAPPGFYRSVGLDPWLFTWEKTKEGTVELVGGCVCESPRRLIVRLCEDVLRDAQGLL